MNLDKEPALREAMTYIKLHPEEWDQRSWICETTGCLAGIAIKLNTELDWIDVARVWRGQSDQFIGKAQALLGLTHREAEKVFYATAVCSSHGQFGHTNCDGPWRHPTYQEFEARVSKVTGLKFKDGEEL